MKAVKQVSVCPSGVPFTEMLECLVVSASRLDGPSGVPFTEMLEFSLTVSGVRKSPSGVPFTEMLESPPLKKPL